VFSHIKTLNTVPCLYSIVVTEITEIERRGEYNNLYHDDNLRVSASEEHDELLVYRDGQDEPEGAFSLSTGELLAYFLV